MSKFNLYCKLIRAWLSARKGLTLMDAVEYALQCVAALAHIDLSTPTGQLVVSLLEGLILGNDHHEAVETPDGQKFSAGPVMTPAHAVALALKGAEDHDTQGIIDKLV